MRANTNKAVFACKVCDDAVIVIKTFTGPSGRKEVSIEIEAFALQACDEEIRKRIASALKKLRYKGEIIAVSFPRNSATCRYLKIPAGSPQEIEKIIQLQAQVYLPYSLTDLIIAYGLINKDSSGYSQADLIITQKKIASRYINLFREVKLTNFNLVLSSYGLASLYNYLKPEDASAAMVIDLNSLYIEIAVLVNKKLITSRSFNLREGLECSDDTLINEIRKTSDIFSKDTYGGTFDKIVIMNRQKHGLERLIKALVKNSMPPVEVIDYCNKFNLDNANSDKACKAGYSLADILGFTVGRIDSSLNLLPSDLKSKIKTISVRKKFLQSGLLLFCIMVIWGINIIKYTGDKEIYLKQLRKELNSIERQAKPLEDIERRLESLKMRLRKGFLATGVFNEIYTVMPEGVYLANFEYDQSGKAVFRGYSREINSILLFTDKLKKTRALHGFDINVKYAASKNTQSGETVEFEISCIKISEK